MREPKFYRMFDYDRTLLPNAHLRSLEEGVTTIEMARQRTGASIGYPGWGAIYFLALGLLRRDRPNVVVETGTNWGSTSIVLAEALAAAGAGGHLFTFELDHDNAVRARDAIAASGHADRVTLIEGDAKAKLAEFAESGIEIDFAFLDGSHLFDDVISEFELVERRLAPGAAVCFDNTYKIAEDGEDSRVFGALKEIKRRFGGNLVNLPHMSWYTPGLAIWQRQPLGGRAGAGGSPGGIFSTYSRSALQRLIEKEKFFHVMDLGGTVTNSSVYNSEFPPNYHLFGVYSYLREMSLSDSNCLDLGTYDGLTAFQLCELGANEIHATCQHSRRQFLLVHALKKYENLRYYPHTHFSDLADIFPPSSFDLLVVSAMLHHHPAPSAALLAIRKLLRPNGLFVLEAAVSITENPSTELNTIALDPVYGNPTIWIPSEATVRGLLKLASFDILSVTRLIGTEDAREANYRRVTILARAVSPSSVRDRSAKLAEIQDQAKWIEGIDFADLDTASARPATISWNGDEGNRTLSIWTDAPAMPLQPRWSNPKPARGTCARIATNDRFLYLMAKHPDFQWDARDVALLSAKYPGEHWPQGMDWSLKQFGNLFCIDAILRHGLQRVLEIGPGFNLFFQNKLPVWVDYHGIDDAGYYETGLLELAVSKHTRGRFIHGVMGGQSTKLPDCYFDCCFSVSVIEHVPLHHIGNVAADLWRVTKPGGWTVHALDVPVKGLKGRANLWIDALRGVGFVLDDEQVDLDTNVTRAAGEEMFLEPMSLVQTFHGGYRAKPWLHPGRKVSNRVSTALLKLRKP